MAHRSNRSDRVRILVVDDEQVVLDLLEEILELDGYEVHKARTVKEALDLITKGRYALVISDFRMPGMGGKEFYKRVKSICPGLARRFVFTSGEMDSQKKKLFINEVGAAVLSKPFGVDEVRRLVSSLAKRVE